MLATEPVSGAMTHSSGSVNAEPDIDEDTAVLRVPSVHIDWPGMRPEWVLVSLSRRSFELSKCVGTAMRGTGLPAITTSPLPPTVRPTMLPHAVRCGCASLLGRYASCVSPA